MESALSTRPIPLGGITRSELINAIGISRNGTLVFEGIKPRAIMPSTRMRKKKLSIYCSSCRSYKPYGMFDFVNFFGRNVVVTRCFLCIANQKESPKPKGTRMHRKFVLDARRRVNYYCTNCGFFKRKSQFVMSRVWTRRAICVPCHMKQEMTVRKRHSEAPIYRRKMHHSWRSFKVCVKCGLSYRNLEITVGADGLCQACNSGLPVIKTADVANMPREFANSHACNVMLSQFPRPLARRRTFVQAFR